MLQMSWNEVWWCEMVVQIQNKKLPGNPESFLWCGQRDLNPHGCPPDPKSGAFPFTKL